MAAASAAAGDEAMAPRQPAWAESWRSSRRAASTRGAAARAAYSTARWLGLGRCAGECSAPSVPNWLVVLVALGAPTGDDPSPVGSDVAAGWLVGSAGLGLSDESSVFSAREVKLGALAA